MLGHLRSWFHSKTYGEGVLSFSIGFNCVGRVPGMAEPILDFETGYLLHKKYTKFRRALEIEIKLNHAAIMQVTSPQAAEQILWVAFQRVCQEISTLKIPQFDGSAFQRDLFAQLNLATQPEAGLLHVPCEAQPVPPLPKPTAVAMPVANFWQLVTQAGEATTYQSLAQCEWLAQALATHTTKQIIGFELQLRKRLQKLYHYDTLAMAKLVEGYVSDDSFLYFCCHLILQGPLVYDQVLRQPDAVTQDLTVHETGEFLLSVADQAFNRKVGPENDQLEPWEYGQALYDYDSCAGPMLGQDWQVTDLPLRFPKLTARYASAGIF
ncbi:hypothetical protein BXP70_26330 [Hymenobacter crusticola]|uniref:DUF4240 domain-containing protein n=2 Tax=Hymenobacter crusticola TaxID=1770526 RepID=A0A243W684_9BACT|nr:hypothetical protein BXP70_26330 [Hymenobacter crusticola]